MKENKGNQQHTQNPRTGGSRSDCGRRQQWNLVLSLNFAVISFWHATTREGLFETHRCAARMKDSRREIQNPQFTNSPAKNNATTKEADRKLPLQATAVPSQLPSSDHPQSHGLQPVNATYSALDSGCCSLKSFGAIQSNQKTVLERTDSTTTWI